jgi:hypothetical protein
MINSSSGTYAAFGITVSKESQTIAQPLNMKATAPKTAPRLPAPISLRYRCMNQPIRKMCTTIISVNAVGVLKSRCKRSAGG